MRRPGQFHLKSLIVRGLWPLTLAGLCGCGSFYDEITSRDLWQQMSSPKDPMTVLKTSHDADRRAGALRSLKEPKQNGGSDQQQDEVMEILSKAATSDRHSTCRWAAIQTLGRFKDPRAVQTLQAAYEQAAGITPSTSSVTQVGYLSRTGSFQPEITGTLRCQALVALGETGDPAAVDLLLRVLKQPPVEGTDQEKQMTLDEKIAAARSLAKFKNDPRVTEALLAILEKERDVALRNRSHESLQVLTGKKLPNDFKAWDEHLHQSAPPTDAKSKEKPTNTKFFGY